MAAEGGQKNGRQKNWNLKPLAFLSTESAGTRPGRSLTVAALLVAVAAVRSRARAQATLFVAPMNRTGLLRPEACSVETPGHFRPGRVAEVHRAAAERVGVEGGPG